MILPQKTIDGRVDAWYAQNASTLQPQHAALDKNFIAALKHDLFLAQSVAFNLENKSFFLLRNATLMYKWADKLGITVISAKEVKDMEKLKRNLEILKLHEQSVNAKEIANIVGISFSAVYVVINNAKKWTMLAHKLSKPKQISSSEVLQTFNDLFITQAIKTNPHLLAGV